MRFVAASAGKSLRIPSVVFDTCYIYLDGRMLAAETAGPHRTLHFHLDHLGTPRRSISVKKVYRSSRWRE